MRKLIIALITPLFIAFLSCSSDSETQEDKIAPTINLSIAGVSNVPESGTIVVSGLIVINVEATDEGGISKVEAFINDEKVGEDTNPPYSITINLSSYTSKAGKTEAFIDYTLKVIATDNTGNTSSTEQNIHIDSQIPSIADLSLEEGDVLNGNTNELTFNVIDNEELSSVIVYLNDIPVTEINEENYKLNLDTSVLTDGENTMKIEAKDVAGNIGSHIVKFIVDNTGPEITLESLKDGQLVDEIIHLNPVVSDEYSDVSSVEIFYGDDIIFKTENMSDINFDFNPENYPTGEAMLKIKSSDNLGNINEKIWTINIVRLLLTLTIPDGYLSPNIRTNHFVFASELDGTFIDMTEIIFETREVKLYAIGEFDVEKDFTVTFASLGRDGVASYLYSVVHLNRENLKQISLVIPNRYEGDGGVAYPINGFSENTGLSSFGRDYSFSSSEAGDTLIVNFTPSNHTTVPGPMYIYGFNPLNNFYNYQLVDRPIASDFEINFSDFSILNLAERQFTTTPANFLNNVKSFSLFGFRNQEDLDNGIYHNIWGYGYGQYISTSSFNYNLNTQFYEYAYELTIGNYHAKGYGLPQDNIIIPNWSVDYTVQNNKLSLTKSGIGHIVGEIYLDDGYNVGVPYQWNLFFDSNKGDEVVLPNIPEALQNYPFYDLYQSNALEINRVGLRKYENINTYEDYLEQIIKGNKAFIRSSSRYESIYSGNTTQGFGNYDYFYNWW